MPGPDHLLRRIRPGRTGEVMVAIRGGVEAFYARDVDGGSIEP
jgi:hypothetical protein